MSRHSHNRSTPTDRIKEIPASSYLPARMADVQDVEIVHAELKPSSISHPSREQLITDAAYHRAESRGFEPGHELEDWLVAESEVDARLQGEGRAY